MWLFVHTPKTAGTSLRWALDKYFGKQNVVCDYGPQGDATSDIVREHLYSEDDLKGPATLVAAIANQNKKILTGHFRLQKYADNFEAQNIITFIREPLVRMCSEYLHRKNNKTFIGTFSDFVRKPGFQNTQSRYLGGISKQSFIGVTEQYGESLQQLNHLAHWKLSTRKKNVGWRGGGRKFAESLSKQESDLFYRMNAEDVALYQSVTRRFTTFENHPA